MDEREILNFWPGRCFGCSQTNSQGLQLHFWRSEQGCFTRCIIPDYLCSFEGLVHGGIIACLLDEVAAWTIIARLARVGVTREMSIRYMKAVPANTELLIEGEIISHDERNAVLHSTVRTADGALRAEGKSEWMLPRLSNIANMAGVEETTLLQFLAKCSQKVSSK